MDNVLTKYIKQIEELCKQEQISYLALFGSQARGDARLDSDIDILVDFKNTPGLIKFIGIEQKLEKTLGKKVDLVTRDGLKKDLLPYINKDLKVIYEQVSMHG